MPMLGGSPPPSAAVCGLSTKTISIFGSADDCDEVAVLDHLDPGQPMNRRSPAWRPAQADEYARVQQTGRQSIAGIRGLPRHLVEPIFAPLLLPDHVKLGDGLHRNVGPVFLDALAFDQLRIADRCAGLRGIAHDAVVDA